MKEGRVPTLDELNAGDKQAKERAFNEFIAPRRGNLVSIARNRLLGNAKGHAEDAVQEALIGVWKRIPAMVDDNLEGYLSTAVVKRSYTHGKNTTREQGKVIYSEQEELEFKNKKKEESVEDTVEKDESYKALMNMLSQNMSQDFLTPLVMKEVEGYDYKEIAEELHIPLGTVQSRIHRGKKQAKEILEKARG
jgi:RNA polymerase sigma-70 factor, ECF subfamily